MIAEPTRPETPIGTKVPPASHAESTHMAADPARAMGNPGG